LERIFKEEIHQIDMLSAYILSCYNEKVAFFWGLSL